MTEVVDRAFRPDHPASFNQNHADDQEYQRLRALARKESEARAKCFSDAHRAYEDGNGALAHQLSEQGKSHDNTAKVYNQQAADFVFRANNALCAPDEIDLHGLYVEEAVNAFEIRVKACQQRREDHLHVIVGKGNHSANHIAKLRPEIERLCQEHQFKYYVEENEGRILIKFGEGMGQLSQGEAASFWGNRPNHGASPGYPDQSQAQSYNQPQPPFQPSPYQGQQQYQNSSNQGGQNNDIVEQVVEQAAPMIIRRLGQCCIIL